MYRDKISLLLRHSIPIDHASFKTHILVGGRPSRLDTPRVSRSLFRRTAAPDDRQGDNNVARIVRIVRKLIVKPQWIGSIHRIIAAIAEEVHVAGVEADRVHLE